jgi:hypothetical protein
MKCLSICWLCTVTISLFNPKKISYPIVGPFTFMKYQMLGPSSSSCKLCTTTTFTFGCCRLVSLGMIQICVLRVTTTHGRSIPSSPVIPSISVCSGLVYLPSSARFGLCTDVQLVCCCALTVS